MSDLDSADPLAKRYPSIHNGGRPPAPSPQSADGTPAATDPQLAKRYPSSANGLQKEASAAAEQVPLSDKLATRYPSMAPPAKEGAATEPTSPVPLELVVPEGIDPKSPVWSEYRAAAAELGLDKEKAGKLVALYQRDRQEQTKAWDAQVSAWYDECTKDSEIAAGVHGARQVVEEYGGQALTDLLNETGYGSHPAVVRAFVKIANALRSAPGR